MKYSGFISRISLSLMMLTFLVAYTPADAQFKPIRFVKDSLNNGLQVIYHIDKSAPVVATVLHYNVGSHYETEGKKGYAHFFEHLMFEATDKIPRASIDKYINEAGGTLNAGTSFDQTVYYFQVPSNWLELPLWIESQRMRKLKVEKEGVETQKGVVLEELKMRQDNSAYGQFLPNICKHGMAGTPYEWSVIGFAEDISNAKISDFKEFYDKYYQPNNATLVIAGDFEISQAKQWVNKYFGSYPRGKVPTSDTFKDMPILKEYKETIEDPKAQLPAVFIGYRAPTMSDSNYYALSLLTDILASGESSRMYQRLVDKEQAAVQSAVVPLNLEYSGALIFYGIGAAGKDIEDVEEIIFDEIEALLEDGITDEELQKAKNITEANFVSGKKGVLEKAQELAKYNSYYGDPNLINTEIDKYLEVTKEDIMRVAKQYLGTDKKVVLTFVPKGK